MPPTLEKLIRERRAGGIDVPTTVGLLRRYAHLERATIRALAGWLLHTPAYETKIRFAYELWGHAERADGLRSRLQELRGGHREANVEPALVQVTDALLHAPGPRSFLEGWCVMLQNLFGAYQDHVQMADPSANAMEQRMLQRWLPELKASIDWADQCLAGWCPDEPSESWGDHVQKCLDAAGGVDGLGDRTAMAPSPPHRFARPTTMAFDHRIQRVNFDGYEARLELPFEQRRIAEFEIFFNELWATGLLATIILDAWHSGAPWAFFHDMAHHLWDEARHAEFGMVRLQELGATPAKVNLDLFEAAQSMPFLHRLCYLTLEMEVYFMPRKRPRVRRYEEAGDHRTQLFADVDWSDEGNHVRYGKRWVDHFLADDARDVATIQNETQSFLKGTAAEPHDGQRSPY